MSTEHTHESYVGRVAELAVAYAEVAGVSVPAFKLVYGVGKARLRGVCYYGTWKNGSPEPEATLEICAMGEAGPVQLAGTTIHEIAHVVAGHKAGHGKDWRAACASLGLRLARAAGMQYQPAYFAPALRHLLAAEPVPTDGSPGFAGNGVTGGGFTGRPVDPAALPPRPCTSAAGCQGGKSQGKGSGSRLRKLTCPDCKYIIRTTAKWIKTGVPTCCCGGTFSE